MKEWKIYMKHYLTVGFLLLFSAYYVNVTLFYHSHIINGTTLVHSHVYGANHQNTPDGNHSSNQLELIATLTQALLTLGVSVVLLHAIALPFCRMVNSAVATSLPSQPIAYYSLRAPPAIIG